MSAVEKAMAMSRAHASAAHDRAVATKAAGGVSFGGGTNPFGDYRSQTKSRKQYALFRGWVHSAVHAIAECAAGQLPQLAKLEKTAEEKKGVLAKTKMIRGRKYSMPGEKAKEVITDHIILDTMYRPNDIQYNYQFVYSFICNLCLTGWGYIIHGESKDGRQEFYSLPTTWIRPIHSADHGAFYQFKIIDPKNPEKHADQKPLERDQVAFAQLPDPSNPLSALSPASAQGMAINIDDAIQTSQEAFFDNGIFPSVVLTVGRNPHPDVPAGVRPRLEPEQRQQVYAAIRKVNAGAANYGNPAIVDGLIERIDRVSMASNEMGWEKSEKSVRTRILSAFGVHPFILGEAMAGSYAQAAIVEGRFFNKVNVFLSLLSTICTDFVPKKFLEKDEEDVYDLWWEEKVSEDPGMKKDLMVGARTRGDITSNEFRTYLGMSENEADDGNEVRIDKAMAASAIQIAEKVTKGTLTVEQGQSLLKALGLPDDIAEEVAGDGPPEPEPGGELDEFGDPIADEGGNVPPGAPGSPQGASNRKPEGNDLEELEAAVDDLKAVLA